MGSDLAQVVPPGTLITYTTLPFRPAAGTWIAAQRCVSCTQAIGCEPCSLVMVADFDRPNCGCGEIRGINRLIHASCNLMSLEELTEALMRDARKFHQPDRG